MNNISLGYSPCPNDTFIFYAMVHNLINTGEIKFNETLLDVETLNQKAVNCELDLSKVSYHAFGRLRDDYCLLRSGSALGGGCGPLLVANNDCSVNDLKNKRIAVPGMLTTAYLLLQLFDPDFNSETTDIIAMPFNEIIASIAKKEVDAGLIIHESRFTYSSYGLMKLMDLGQWWEEETGLPIPLGGIIAKRELGSKFINSIDSILHESIEFAFNNSGDTMRYIKEHSHELSDDVIKQHIDLYVNDHSLDIGITGEKAITELINRAERAGIIPSSDKPLFI